MSGSLVGAIGRGWRDPRGTMATQIHEGLDEARALFHLMLACGLLCVASLPGAVRASRSIEADDPLSGAIAAYLFGYLFVLPLIAYGAAALMRLVAQRFGGTGSYLAMRSALFWTMLAGAPIALGLALVRVFAEAAPDAGLLPMVTLLGYAGLAVWIWLLAGAIAAAEGFGSTMRVAVAIALVFVGAGLLVSGLAGGGRVAG